MTYIYQAIASKIQAIRNCQKSGNSEWESRHGDSIAELIRDYLPSGSGFDSGTGFDIADNVDDKRERLTFVADFHHMNSDGYYDGWTQHSVIVTPSFAGFDIKVTGRDRNGIKEYIAECFHNSLWQSVAN